jgi:O6-methylguanine-DNA--protein-cysteine methyltransferase
MNKKELKKMLETGGFRVNDQGEISIIGERDGKEYKIGQVRKRTVSSEEMEKFLEKSDKQERERERETKNKLRNNEKKEKITKEKVYKKVGEIPDGCFSTYKIIANELGSKAYQLIGNFLQKHNCQLNSDGQTVNCSSKTRCYKVIKTDYSLGSFKFDNGEDKPIIKKRMLEKEGIGLEKRGNK